MSAASASILLVHVAQRDDLDRRDLDQAEQVALAVPAAADQADARRLAVGERGGVAAGGGQGQAGGAGVQEIAAVHGCGLQERVSVWAVVYRQGTRGSEYFAGGSLLNYALFVTETWP